MKEVKFCGIKNIPFKILFEVLQQLH